MGFFEGVAMTVHLVTMFPARLVATGGLLWCLLLGPFSLKFLVLLYVAHLLWDQETPHRGGRRWDPFRQSSYFQCLSSYFPIHLVQTEKLSPDRNYLATLHPHGVWFFAHSLVFGADVCGLQAQHTLTPYATTLDANFKLPIAREYLLASGFVSASERSLTHLLSRPSGGNIVSLIPGGSTEASLAAPRQYRVILRRRKGFCRVALQTGASLVPCIVFGEVDCYSLLTPKVDRILGRLIKYIQNLVYRWTGFNPVIYRHPDHKLGFLSLPKPTPITVVTGAPIDVEKTPTPTREQIDQLHTKYLQNLEQFFETQKYNYIENAENVKLAIE